MIGTVEREVSQAIESVAFLSPAGWMAIVNCSTGDESISVFAFTLAEVLSLVLLVVVSTPRSWRPC